MIDISKMKALATQLREWNWLNDQVPQDAADAIDTLLSELEAANQKRKEAVMDAERAREERNREHVKLNAEWIEKTAELRAELEAREAEVTRLRACALKYLAWLDVADPKSGLDKDLNNAEMVGAALAQRQEGEDHG